MLGGKRIAEIMQAYVDAASGNDVVLALFSKNSLV